MEKIHMEQQQSGARLSTSSPHPHPHLMSLASSNDFSHHYAAALQWHHHTPQDHTAEICWEEEQQHPQDSPTANNMPSFQQQAAWVNASNCPPFPQQHRSMEGVVLHTGNVTSLVCENSESAVLNDSQGCSEGEKTFPLSVVSGHHSIPFACKLNVPVNECRDMSFATMSGCSDESEVMYRGFAEGDMKLPSVMGKGELDPKAPGQHDKCVPTIVTGLRSDGAEKVEQLHCVQAASSTTSYSDPAMGLRLGKRTYFEDGVASNITSEATLRSPGSLTAAGNGSSSTYSTTTGNTTPHNNGSTINGTNDGSGSSSSKKLKTSPTVAVPRCQAEGCKADLSGAKDYHRRHKVCEWHSKASKAKVANLEQRFCQQCSRFHVLSEFDEGKRSCRRRLAGHNERRRKSQPEPMSLLSPGSFAYLADAKHLLGASFLDHPCFLQHKRAHVASSLDAAALACQLGLLAAAGADHAQALNLLPSNVKEEPVAANQFPALELHHFVQGSRGLMAGGNGGGGPLVVTGGGGHGLAFSNPLGTMALSIAPASNMGLLPTDPQPPSEVAASGRALSLLSSSLGSPTNPCSMSMSMSLAVPSSSCMHQLLTENGQQATASLQALTLHSSSHHIPHSYNALANSPTGNAITNCPSYDGGQPSALQNFDGQPSYLSIVSDSSYESLQNGTNERRILDLMSSEPNHHRHHHQQVEVQYMDLEGLSMFGRSDIM